MDKKEKWIQYEKRWKWRDIYFNKALRRHGIVKYFHREPVMPHYAGKWVMGAKKTNDYIYDRIKQGKPFRRWWAIWQSAIKEIHLKMTHIWTDGLQGLAQAQVSFRLITNICTPLRI